MCRYHGMNIEFDFDFRSTAAMYDSSYRITHSAARAFNRTSHSLPYITHHSRQSRSPSPPRHPPIATYSYTLISQPIITVTITSHSHPFKELNNSEAEKYLPAHLPFTSHCTVDASRHAWKRKKSPHTLWIMCICGDCAT